MKLKHEGYCWHHEITHFPSLAIDGRISSYDKHSDFCSYTRWFLWKLLVVIPASILLIGAYLGCYFAGWANLFSGGDFELFRNNNVAWILTHGIMMGIGIIALFCYSQEKYKSARTESNNKYESDLSAGLVDKKEPSFVLTWYKKIKDKYCPTMDY